ncbi:MAG: hypothetical protein H6700_05465, partial [Myxococcales bacterium]|nr:hypothetical protein [Myxococcales bacterium]
MLDPIALPDSDDVLADRTLAHLSRVVAIDSASDERSDTIPSTDGQRVLAAALVDFFAERGCSVDVDRFGSVVATLAGRGALADAAPLALLVHLDTARGTAAEPSLDVRRAWDGTRVPYRDNDALQVSVENYPDLERYLDQDLVFGSGTAPFGLDDKLGLAHMMTLVDTLARHTGVPHVPLVLVARPDEEIGRHAALVGVAEELSGRGVTFGYTLDGLEPYEINTENFNASQATVRFASRAPDTAAPIHLEIRLGGVNTHGATAREEGHRAATRFGAQLVARLRAEGVDARAVGFESDALRDCDAVACFACGSESDAAAVEAAV